MDCNPVFTYSTAALLAAVTAAPMVGVAAAGPVGLTFSGTIVELSGQRSTSFTSLVPGDAWSITAVYDDEREPLEASPGLAIFGTDLDLFGTGTGALFDRLEVRVGDVTLSEFDRHFLTVADSANGDRVRITGNFEGPDAGIDTGIVTGIPGIGSLTLPQQIDVNLNVEDPTGSAFADTALPDAPFPFAPDRFLSNFTLTGLSLDPDEVFVIGGRVDQIAFLDGTGAVTGLLPEPPVLPEPTVDPVTPSVDVSDAVLFMVGDRQFLDQDGDGVLTSADLPDGTPIATVGNGLRSLNFEASRAGAGDPVVVDAATGLVLGSEVVGQEAIDLAAMDSDPEVPEAAPAGSDAADDGPAASDDAPTGVAVDETPEVVEGPELVESPEPVEDPAVTEASDGAEVDDSVQDPQVADAPESGGDGELAADDLPVTESETEPEPEIVVDPAVLAGLGGEEAGDIDLGPVTDGGAVSADAGGGVDLSVVPSPTAAAAGFGLLGLLGRRRRRDA